MDKKRIHEMLECMTKWCTAELDKGKEHVDTKEMGDAIDMVKDLAEAEKSVWEKCYYEKIVEAMEKAEEDEKEGRMPRMGYDNWRYSDGRFAPTGHGHEVTRAGFYPMPMDDEEYPWWGRRIYGYDGSSGRSGQSQGHDTGRSGSGSGQSGSAGGRMGFTSLDEYEEARQEYQKSGSAEHKQKMNKKAEECVADVLGTMTDIWADADPEMRERMKNKLFQTMRQFGL